MNKKLNENRAYINVYVAYDTAKALDDWRWRTKGNKSNLVNELLSKWLAKQPKEVENGSTSDT